MDMSKEDTFELLRTLIRKDYEPAYETFTKPPRPRPGYFKTHHLDRATSPLNAGIILSNFRLGNAMDGGQLRHAPCANNHDASIDKVCDKKGTLECARCHLVRYCSTECQKHDWPHHKVTCKGAVARGDYNALWTQYSGPTKPIVPGPEMYLFGNTPAVNLKGPGCTNILLAASGDLRHVLETVFALPQGAKIKFVLNDNSPHVVWRNYLMLTLLERFGTEAVDMVINLWYSTTLTTQQKYVAKLHALWLFHKGGKEGSAIHSHVPSELLAATRYMAAIIPVSAEVARELPRQLYFNPMTRRFVDAHLFSMGPWHRLAHIHRQLYSTLLPFGARDVHLAMPNDTFFLNNEFHPPPFAHPTQGWDLHQVDQVQGMPKNDLYGKLYMHVAVRLEKLAQCLQNGQLTIDMYMDDAMGLPRVLKGQTFDVIDVSNTCDDSYCGPTIIPTLAPLLNTTNPDATIVSCFMMWAMKHLANMSAYVQKTKKACTKMTDFLHKNGYVTDHVNADMLTTMTNKQKEWFVDMEPHFKPHLPKFPKSKLRPRDVHRIVPKRIHGSMTDYKVHRDPTPLDFCPWHSFNDVFVEWELSP